MKMKNMIPMFLIQVLLCLPINAQNFIPLWNKKNMPNSKGVSIKDSMSNELIYIKSGHLDYTYLNHLILLKDNVRYW